MSSDAAPAELEPVRAFLNSWRLPTDTRVPVDLLEGWVADPATWRAEVGDLPVPQAGDVAELRALRAELRSSLGQTHPLGLRPLVARHRLRPHLLPDSAPRAVAWAPEGDAPADTLVAAAVTAVAEGRWHRLKSCPDCQHVFYDVSRNASRTWCAMTPATPGTRACGAAAKTKAYRERVRRQAAPGS